MKKYILMFVLLMLFLGVIGCQGEYSYSYDEMVENVDHISIEQIILNSSSRSVQEIIFIKDLTTDEADIFIDEISQVKFYYPLGDLDSVRGYVFVIYDKDGSYEKLSQYATEFYSSSGESTGGLYRQCSEEDFLRILALFIDITS
ncbi:MAG: hypothetical protein AB7U79_04500 [Candidatus Izemoplasmatales bacterium]